jgi:hypothetical protein
MLHIPSVEEARAAETEALAKLHEEIAARLNARGAEQSKRAHDSIVLAMSEHDKTLRMLTIAERTEKALREYDAEHIVQTDGTVNDFMCNVHWWRHVMLPGLLKEPLMRGKWILVAHMMLQAHHDTFDQAMTNARANFKPGEFLVQLVVENEFQETQQRMREKESREVSSADA